MESQSNYLLKMVIFVEFEVFSRAFYLKLKSLWYSGNLSRPNKLLVSLKGCEGMVFKFWSSLHSTRHRRIFRNCMQLRTAMFSNISYYTTVACGFTWDVSFFFIFTKCYFFNKAPLIKDSNVTYYALVLRLIIYDGMSFDVEHIYISTISVY